jgi:hypothetical protein
MERLTTADEPGIDWQECGDITNEIWFELAKGSPTERQALANAAAARLRELLREPGGEKGSGLIIGEARKWELAGVAGDGGQLPLPVTADFQDGRRGKHRGTG